MGYIIYHKRTMNKVGYARTLSGAKMGWDLTPGGDYACVLESDWKR